MAKLFCLSITRDPEQSVIHVSKSLLLHLYDYKTFNFCFAQASVMRVIGRVDAREKYKLELALKYCRAKMTEFRSEERRKVQYKKQLLVNASLHIYLFYRC